MPSCTPERGFVPADYPGAEAVIVVNIPEPDPEPPAQHAGEPPAIPAVPTPLK
ncbi:hypothetical protein [Sphaerisporangium album]|uniref:hypothetical protein n=1 Tax=Sphaerisporangium album TaxID=509200 RepID=UPI0015F0D98D|nr:hypothetical protein [Sphaerisporangium album]